jgi:hypothetical protein
VHVSLRLGSVVFTAQSSGLSVDDLDGFRLGIDRFGRHDFQFDGAEFESIAHGQHRVGEGPVVEQGIGRPRARHCAALAAENDAVQRPHSHGPQSQRAVRARADRALGALQADDLAVAAGASDAEVEIAAGVFHHAWLEVLSGDHHGSKLQTFRRRASTSGGKDSEKALASEHPWRFRLPSGERQIGCLEDGCGLGAILRFVKKVLHIHAYFVDYPIATDGPNGPGGPQIGVGTPEDSEVS